ncbi:hypothetical protein BDZ88DRAFT_430188, partial [Geranomyces variabilis]
MGEPTLFGYAFEHRSMIGPNNSNNSNNNDTNDWKVRGNTLYAQGQHLEAVEVYTKALDVPETDALKTAMLYSNRAAAYLKHGASAMVSSSLLRYIS